MRSDPRPLSSGIANNAACCLANSIERHCARQHRCPGEGAGSRTRDRLMTLAADVFVHPNAVCESEQVGPGTRIWAFAHVMKGAVVGRDCNIGGHAFIEAGARIGDRVTVKNQTMVWNGVEIADDAFIGPGVSFTNDAYPRSARMPHAAVALRYADQSRWLARTRVEVGAS